MSDSGSTKGKFTRFRSNSVHSFRNGLSKLNLVSEKRQKSWYYASMYPSYKTRKKEFKHLFPDSHKQKFVVDYSCAYHKDILHQGRMFVTSSACCFYSYIFGWEQRITVLWRDVVSVTKEKTALFIPNAIQLTTKDGKFFFASFVDRDSSFLMLVKFWQAAASEQWLTEEDIDQIIALNYGEGDEEEEGLEEEDGLEEELGGQVPPEIVDHEQEEEEMAGEVKSVLDTWLQEAGGSIVCDKTLARPLAEVYGLLYTNSNFFFTFHKDRASTELDIGEWEEGGREGDRVREVSYNMSLNNPVGPKKCQVKEVQKMKHESVIENQIYCIETEAENSGVPYADSFMVVTRSCLVAVGEGRARFIAKAEITFKKDLWSFLKDKIEANAWSGITGYYAQLATALESYSSLQPELAQSSRREEKSRRQSRGQGVQGARAWGWRDWLLHLLVLLLLVTSCLNTIALLRLSSLPESHHQQQPPLPPLPPLRLDTSKLRHPSDWLALLDQQASFYSSRSAGLRTRLLTAVGLLARAEQELTTLEEELGSMGPGDWREGTNCDSLAAGGTCDRKEMHQGHLEE